GIAHVGEAAAVDEVNNQLEFVQDFKVSKFGLISRADQGLKPSFDQCAYSAAKNSLLSKEISLCLFLKRRLQHSGASAADALGIGEGEGVRLAGRILMHCNK